MSKITVVWQLHGHGKIDLSEYVSEFNELSDEEIEDWIMEVAQIQVFTQGGVSFQLIGFEEAILKLRESQGSE